MRRQWVRHTDLFSLIENNSEIVVDEKVTQMSRFKPIYYKQNLPFPVHPDFLVSIDKEKMRRKSRLKRIRAKREARALELRAKDK
jgi:hypothetical protein